jgi:hypothetical protein
MNMVFSFSFVYTLLSHTVHCLSWLPTLLLLLLSITCSLSAALSLYLAISLSFSIPHRRSGLEFFRSLFTFLYHFTILFLGLVLD